jgi:hypothetical protein
MDNNILKIYKLLSLFSLELVPKIFWVLVLSFCYSKGLLPAYGYLVYSYMPLILVLLTLGCYVSVPTFVSKKNIEILRQWAVPTFIAFIIVAGLFYLYGYFFGLFFFVLMLTTLQNSIVFSVIRISTDKKWIIFYSFMHIYTLLCVALAIYSVSLACLVYFAFSTIFFLSIIFSKLKLRNSVVKVSYLWGLTVTFLLGFTLRNFEKPILLVYGDQYFAYYSIVFIYLSHLVAIINQIMNFLYTTSFSTKKEYFDKLWLLWSLMIKNKKYLLLVFALCISGLIYCYLIINDVESLIIACVAFNLLPFMVFSIFSPILNRSQMAVTKKFRVLVCSGSISLAIVSIALFLGAPPYFYPALFNIIFCVFVIFMVREDDIFE